MIHFFKTSREAYDASQCYDNIKDGDILVATSTMDIAVLVKAWPTSVGPRSKHCAFDQRATADEMAEKIVTAHKRLAEATARGDEAWIKSCHEWIAKLRAPAFPDHQEAFADAEALSEWAPRK